MNRIIYNMSEDLTKIVVILLAAFSAVFLLLGGV
jgi:hypothetical protein